jgi:hypothetical protein
LKIAAEGHVARVIDALSSVKLVLDILTDCTVCARKWIFQTQAARPSLLPNAVTHSSPSFPQGNIAPFPLSNVSANLLNKLGDVNIYINDEVLNYIIILPVFSRGKSEVIKLIPIHKLWKIRDFSTLTQNNQYCVLIRLGSAI